MTGQLTNSTMRIIAMNSNVAQNEYTLQEEVYTIGRSSSCSIVISSHLISRVHARIERQQQRYVLYDEQSANGTFVNNRRINGSYILKDQDVIGLGAATPLLRFDDADPTFVPSNRLRYDDEALLFLIDNKPLQLPPTPFRLLRHLYEHGGSVCSREECAMAIWGRAFNEETDNGALDRAIYSLRRTLQQQSGGEDFVKTRRGLGYLLEV